MDGEGPKRFVNGDRKRGIHSSYNAAEDEKYDPIARAKVKEILEPKGFTLIYYEIEIVAAAEEARKKGMYEAFLKEKGIEYEHLVPDLMFECKAGWGYIECEVLTNAWFLDTKKHKYPDTVRYLERKHHFASDLKYKKEEAIFWYIQLCAENLDLHHIFSINAMRRGAYPEVARNKRESNEVFRYICKGLQYVGGFDKNGKLVGGLYDWIPDKMFEEIDKPVFCKLPRKKHCPCITDEGECKTDLFIKLNYVCPLLNYVCPFCT